MNDIYSGIEKGVLESVINKAKKTVYIAGETAKHYVHNAYELVSGDDDEEVDLEANYKLRRGYHAITMEPHCDFMQYDE
uniref:Uncharacterized protein n=1 Tax=Plectus sambesii TaxID=2011161 RepID=A0A914VE17_9BILA